MLQTFADRHTVDLRNYGFLDGGFFLGGGVLETANPNQSLQNSENSE